MQVFAANSWNDKSPLLNFKSRVQKMENNSKEITTYKSTTLQVAANSAVHI
jgi:hypothetical protein